MFAIVKTGGKQYKVSPGDLLTVERLEGDAGQSVLLTSVLLINNEGEVTTGVPFLSQAQVKASIVKQARGDKIIVFKKKRRQGYRRRAGHRQDLTILRIEGISASGEHMDSTPVSDTRPKKERVTEIVMYPKDTAVSSSAENSSQVETKSVKKTKPVQNQAPSESLASVETAAQDKTPVKKAAPKKSKASASQAPSEEIVSDASKSE